MTQTNIGGLTVVPDSKKVVFGIVLARADMLDGSHSGAYILSRGESISDAELRAFLDVDADYAIDDCDLDSINFHASRINETEVLVITAETLETR